MSERSESDQAGPRRSFSAEGYTWTVHELPPRTDGRGKSLVFSREHVVRRVWSYPENWYSLSDEELGHLVECR
jgi:hypothetical protein